MHNNDTDALGRIMPLVSVVIPTYNSAQYIGETLQSVLDQQYPRLEVIVVDDGSTDNTEKVVRDFDSEQITYIYQPNSGGPSRPRNRGVQEARGDYIAFIDSDDIMLPGRIMRGIELLYQVPHLGLAFTNFVKFDEGGQYPGAFLDTYKYFQKLPKQKAGAGEYVISAESAYDGLIEENYIGLSSVLVPKAIFSKIGTFDESLSGPEDYDLWLRITHTFDIGFINVIGHRYRVRAGSILSRGDSKLIPPNIRVLQKQLEKKLADGTRKRVHKRLAHLLWALGYCYQIDGDMHIARQHYLLSLQEAHNWLSWKGLLTTLLGGNFLRILKNARSAMQFNRHY